MSWNRSAIESAAAPALRRPGRAYCLRASRGFTLLEVLVVIGLLAALSSLVVAVGGRASRAGHTARARTELAVLAAALENYRRVCGDYPRTGDGARWLQSLIGHRGPGDESITMPSLIEPARFVTFNGLDPLNDATAVLVDPWNQPYRYAYKTQSPWTNAGYVLYSTGPDGCDSGILLTGGFADPAPPENADNLTANRN